MIDATALTRPGSLLPCLRAAWLEFLAAWKRKGYGRTSRQTRSLSGMAALATLGAIVAAGAAWDVDARAWAAGLPGGVVRVFEFITKFGESGYVFALIAIVGVWAIAARGRGDRARVEAGLTQLAARAMFLFCVAAGSGLASQALKHMFGRARPKLYDVVGPFHFDTFSIYATYASFPSGHAVTAFAMALAIYYLSPRVGMALFICAALVAASRVIIGAHYLSDVLAGVALGVASSLILRREFAARGVVFARAGETTRLRGRGLIWPAVKAALRRRPPPVTR